MRKNFVKVLLIIFVLLSLFPTVVCSSQNTGRITLTSRLLSDTVPLNREAQFIVEARWEGKPGEVTIVSIDPPALTNLTLVSTATSNQVLQEDGQHVTLRRYEFYLKGETLGMAYLDDVKLKYRDSDGDENILRTARLQLKVVDPISESLKSYSLYTVLGGIASLFLAIGAVVFILSKRRKKRAFEAENEEMLIPLEEQYKNKLKQEVDLHSDKLEEQYSNIANILREYLNKALALGSFMRTTQELIEYLGEQQVEMAKVASIQEILQACDLVKFSGSSVDPNQLARLYTLLDDLLKEPIQADIQTQNVAE